MSTRSNSRSSTYTAESQAQDAMADATRQQMANSASAASVLLNVFDSIQQTQHRMLQRAALLQEQTADRLRHATTPAEMMGIQSSVMMSTWTEMAQYAQDLTAAIFRAQGELSRPGESQDDSPAARTASAAHAASAASMSSVAAPLFQAWQAMFTPPPSGHSQRHH